MTPKKYPQNIHTPKNIHLSENRKKSKFKILNPEKWPETTYVWKYQSTPSPPGGWHAGKEVNYSELVERRAGEG